MKDSTRSGDGRATCMSLLPHPVLCPAAPCAMCAVGDSSSFNAFLYCCQQGSGIRSTDRVWLQAGGSDLAAPAAWPTIKLLLESPFQRSDCCAAMHMGGMHAAAACRTGAILGIASKQLHTHALLAGQQRQLNDTQAYHKCFGTCEHQGEACPGRNCVAFLPAWRCCRCWRCRSAATTQPAQTEGC